MDTGNQFQILGEAYCTGEKYTPNYSLSSYG